MQRMSPSCISLERAPKTTPLFLDYLYHYDRVAQFYGGSPQDFESFQNIARAIDGSYPHRAEVADLLEHQNRVFGCGEATLANIQRLKDRETYAVVAGQQVGLFSGPAFTLYKALTAIRVAQSLTDQGLKCVPVFWLATEDHDLDEVSKTRVLNESGGLVDLSISGQSPSPASSVGYVKLADGVLDALDQVEQALPESDARARLMRDLRECYAPGATWGEAFGRFMARLFGSFGVILIDPLYEGYHRLAQPLYARALDQASHLRDLLGERSQELTKAGYHVQVHVGPESTLMFAAAAGGRTPICRNREHFYLNNNEPVAPATMEAWLRERPLDFTPSALLRPIVQDILLPTVCYIPGPAELAYFAQAQAIYPEFGRPAPVLFPRAGFTLADRHDQRLMEKYQLTLDDLWQGEEHLGRRIAAGGREGSKIAEWSGRMDRGEQDLKQFLDLLAGDIEKVDPTLLDALRTAREKMTYQLERLRGKISRASLDRSEMLTRHQRALWAHLMPGGSLQERQVNGINYLGRAGYELLDRLLLQLRTHCLDHQYFVY